MKKKNCAHGVNSFYLLLVKNNKINVTKKSQLLKQIFAQFYEKDRRRKWGREGDRVGKHNVGC